MPPSAAQASGLGQTRAFSFSSALRPDMAAIGAVVALFYALFLFQGYSKFFRDSDTGWHIRTGEMILRTGSLPHADPFSFTRPGQPWLAWEWLSDILMGSVHQSTGLTGVAMLYGIAIAAGVWLWFRLNWDTGGNFLLACILASPVLSTCNIHWLARPHVFSWIFLLAAVRFCERLRSCQPLQTRLSWVQLAGIVGFTALWTNVHASFFFAPLIPLLWAVGTALRGFLWEGEDTRARTLALLQTAGVALLATFLNPYGWQLHAHVGQYLFDHDLLDRIGEFQSFNYHASGALPITLCLAIAMAGAVFALATRRVEHFLFSALLIVAALRSARGLPLVALLAIPLANGAITEALRSASGLRGRVRAALDGFLTYGERLRQLDSRNNGILVIAAACVLFALLLRAPGIVAATGFPKDQFPVAAAAAVAQLPQNARMFAPDKFGGYLIYKFNGSRKVFFDGRSDFYGAGFLRDYARIVQVRPGWKTLFDGFGFTYALLPKDNALIGALETRGWTVLYSDATASLMMLPDEGLTRSRNTGPETN